MFIGYSTIILPKINFKSLDFIHPHFTRFNRNNRDVTIDRVIGTRPVSDFNTPEKVDNFRCRHILCLPPLILSVQITEKAKLFIYRAFIFCQRKTSGKIPSVNGFHIVFACFLYF